MRIRRSTWVGIAAIAFWGGAIGWAVHSQFRDDPRGLLRLGAAFHHPRELAGAPVFPGDGYDGQFFAALSVDPWLLRPDAARSFDAPAYRATRIGLPAAAWILALGDGARAVLVYQVLAWLLGALGIWVVARWLESAGTSPWWATPLILSTGLLASFTGSMPDPAAMTLALLALRRDRDRQPGVVALMVAAVLVRDVTLVTSLAIGLVALRDRRLAYASRVVGVPVLALGLWKAYVIARIGPTGLDVPGGNFGLPLAWLPEKLSQHLDAPEVLALGAVAVSVAGGLMLLPRIARWTAVEASYVSFTLVALFMSRLAFAVNWWSYSRVLLPLALLSVVVAGTLRAGFLRAWFLAISIAWAAATAAVIPRWAGALTLAVILGMGADRFLRTRTPSDPRPARG